MVTNQQVTYIQSGWPAFTGPQGGMVIIQPTGGVTTTTPAYLAVAQPQVYVQQQVHVSYILKKRLWSVSNKNECTCIEVLLFVLWQSHFQVCSVETH